MCCICRERDLLLCNFISQDNSSASIDMMWREVFRVFAALDVGFVRYFFLLDSLGHTHFWWMCLFSRCSRHSSHWLIGLPFLLTITKCLSVWSQREDLCPCAWLNICVSFCTCLSSSYLDTFCKFQLQHWNKKWVIYSIHSYKTLLTLTSVFYIINDNHNLNEMKKRGNQEKENRMCYCIWKRACIYNNVFE